MNARKNYEKLPAKLLEIIDEFDVEEFHLTLSSGRWQDSYHQSIPSTLHLAGGDGEGAGGRRGRGRGNVIPPSGIELYAWLAPSPLRYAGTMEEMTTREMRVIEEEEAERWRNFKGAIAGLFCAGIGNAPEDNSAEGVPSWSFSPDGLVDPGPFSPADYRKPRLTNCRRNDISLPSSPCTIGDMYRVPHAFPFATTLRLVRRNRRIDQLAQSFRWSLDGNWSALFDTVRE